MVFPQLIGVVALLPAPATREVEIAIVIPIVLEVLRVVATIAEETFRCLEVIGLVPLIVVKVDIIYLFEIFPFYGYNGPKSVK